MYVLETIEFEEDETGGSRTFGPYRLSGSARSAYVCLTGFDNRSDNTGRSWAVIAFDSYVDNGAQINVGTDPNGRNWPTFIRGENITSVTIKATAQRAWCKGLVFVQ